MFNNVVTIISLPGLANESLSCYPGILFGGKPIDYLSVNPYLASQVLISTMAGL